MKIVVCFLRCSMLIIYLNNKIEDLIEKMELTSLIFERLIHHKILLKSTDRFVNIVIILLKSLDHLDRQVQFGRQKYCFLYVIY